MDFTTWTRHLSDRDIHVIPPSHPTPIRVRALLSSGDLVEFLCRGTTASLSRYSAGDLLFIEPRQPREGCVCGCGEALAERVTAPRLDIRPDAGPAQVAQFDGAIERGWTGYEAGLLSVDEAALLFDSLLLGVAPFVPPTPDAERAVRYDGVGTFCIRTDGLSGFSLSTTASAASTGRSVARYSR